MPSPSHRKQTSTSSAHGSNTSPAAIRRGDINISSPMLQDADSANRHTVHDLSPSLGPRSACKDGTWPRKSMPPRMSKVNRSAEHHEPLNHLSSYNTTARVSTPLSLSSAPSKRSISRRKTGGFRATMRRIFGNKKRSDSITEEPEALILVSLIIYNFRGTIEMYFPACDDELVS